MPINLQEIRTAVNSYIDTKVTVSISPVKAVPAAGSEINPTEDFTFTLSAKNADAASGGIALKDIVWRVWVVNESVGKLYVPASGVARAVHSDTAPALPAGSLVREMYYYPLTFALPPLDSARYLAVGDTDSVTLKGKADANPVGGITNIQFKIYADIDMEWLFPQDEDSATVTAPLVVHG